MAFSNPLAPSRSRPLASGVRKIFASLWLLTVAAHAAFAADDASLSRIDAQIAAHPHQSGAYVLDSAEEALIARAWLADQAKTSIEVQYFIWSTDNIGILAAEALLRAAERGVKVRVIVDDLLVDAPDKSLLALAQHPNFDIRIYNPKVSVGVPLHKRIWNAMTDLRGVNMRMHDKTFVVDGKVAITGGRNMASEYYDYHQRYNFRDRDVLLAGPVVTAIRESFDRFWSNEITAAVESLYPDLRLSDQELKNNYADIHAYANDPRNFESTVRSAIVKGGESIERITRDTRWGRVDFVCDIPGKNESATSFDGGGRSGATLGALIAEAKSRVLIQSPYLVPSGRAVDLFRDAIKRGARIAISTNSLASTDNLQAFAGYKNQRDDLLRWGIDIFEYRPDAATQKTARDAELVKGFPIGQDPEQIFGLHAKTMVIDSSVVFIGTFNLDPRSENLNTEVGAVIYNAEIARKVEQAIELDMNAGNSWNAQKDDPDQHATFAKRMKVKFWQAMPIKPLL